MIVTQRAGLDLHATFRPLRGAEKFVLKFPHHVLNSFVRSFPIVQRLDTLSETQLNERFLMEWWPSDLGGIPEGSESIALMRLATQVQSAPAAWKIISAFRNLPPEDRLVLSTEMARTGIQSQAYALSPVHGVPAFLAYYSPAFLRQSMDDPLAALRVLAKILFAATFRFLV